MTIEELINKLGLAEVSKVDMHLPFAVVLPLGL